MTDLLVLTVSLLFCLALLAIERSWIARRRRRLRLCVAVTGTRGKSSVTRLIAAGLRADGSRVLAKTTGSQPVEIFPSGKERRIRRWGGASILEQRRFLRRARSEAADALVCEVMSVRPESYAAELGRILRPNLVVVTNVRLDHIDDLGPTLPEAAQTFAQGIAKGTRVLAIPGECPEALFVALSKRGVEVVRVEPAEVQLDLPYPEWPANVALALAACEVAGVPRRVALTGMRTVKPDFGALGAWRIEGKAPGTASIFVNAFAANDPQSTRAALEAATARWGGGRLPRVGILNLRGDRGDRTAQWCQALRDRDVAFDGLLLAGHVPRSVVRAVRLVYPGALVVRGSRPGRVMAEIRQAAPRGGLVFGLGNIARLGTRLIERWEKEGEAL